LNSSRKLLKNGIRVVLLFAQKHKLLEEIISFSSLEIFRVSLPIDLLDYFLIFFLKLANGYPRNYFFSFLLEFIHEGILDVKYSSNKLPVGVEVLPKQVCDSNHGHTSAAAVF
jgi:hypothetical protein